jgi:triosephosphate isomerase (TIM)
MARPTIIVGNWKMNLGHKDIQAFFETMKGAQGSYQCEAWVTPQFPYLTQVKTLARPLKIKVGAQNCSHQENGAFTGDVSPLALKDLEIDFVILGHSERRTIFKEDNKILNQKMLLALKTGLTVVFCVGETLQEREQGSTEKVIKTQMEEGLKNLSPNDRARLLIAYEPVWAIGTGKTATPAQAQEVHTFIRHKTASACGLDPQGLIILYGGSVKPDNISHLLAEPDIDGALVGGASLKANDFIALCKGKNKT